jgi:hypothetical protein
MQQAQDPKLNLDGQSPLVVVGKGHTRKTEAKLAPKLLEWCKQEGLDVNKDDTNEGRIIIPWETIRDWNPSGRFS